jgi:CubicO group peptidase (beta-lactamase class C family)
MFHRSRRAGTVVAMFVVGLASVPLVMGGVEKQSIRVGELVFDARVTGPSDGQLVLLLHGFPQTSFAFRRQLEWLGAEGFRAVAPDQRGYSPGARPEGIEQYAMGALVGDVLGIADALGYERFHLVGHDWGGAVAWVTALRHPERLISLTVISTPHVLALAESLADRQSDQAARSSYMEDFAAEGSEARFLADNAARLRAVFDGGGLTPHEIQTYVDALGSEEALKGALNWYRASALSRGAPRATSPPPTPRPISISIPTLYVWGSEDRAFGRRAAEATARFVDGPYQFVPLEGVGHWVIEQAPERLDPLLREHLHTWRAAEELGGVFDRFEGLGYSGAVLVARGSSVLAVRAFGLRDRERALPNTIETRFEVMSVTKLFVALSLVMLESEGKLRMDARLSEYLGPFPDDKRELTVQDLLLHTAGFPTSGQDLDKSSASAFVQSLKQAPLESMPGEAVHYSNPGYALGAVLVEKVSGQSFPEFLRERVFRPAGMRESGFTGEGDEALGYAGPLATPELTPPPEPGVGVLGATGIVSTVGDLFRFYRALRDRTLLPESGVEKFLREHREGHGYSWQIDTVHGVRRLFKDGSWPSYESLLALYPDSDDFVVSLSNRNLGLSTPLLTAIESVLYDGAREGAEVRASVSTLPLSRELRSNGRLGGVSVAVDGSIYVSNFSASVWKISPQGEVVTLTSSLRGSSGNTVDRKGNLLQASFLDGRIVRIAPTGEMTTLVEGGLEGPVGLAADDQGNVFVCNCRGGSISRVDSQGKVTTFARSDRFQCPNGLTFGPDGNLYVVSFENGDVVRVKPEGETSVLATLPGGGNAHIAYAGDSFFVTQIESNRIYRLFADGRFEPFAGTGVLGLKDGALEEATLSRPNGIATGAGGKALYLNNLVGTWRGDEETSILLRRIFLP